ncbi:MAG: magnesium-translocating P-type ATPase [Candidatus Berkiellales bacterium]
MKDKLPSKEFLLKIAQVDVKEVFAELNSSPSGLTPEEVENRLDTYGKNQVAREQRVTWYYLLLSNFKNPFIIVLIIIGAVSYITGDIRATIVVSMMVILSVLMRFIQEYRSSRAAEALREMVLTKATVKRNRDFVDEEGKLIALKTKAEIPFEEIVPGDIIYLSAGDMIPADVRLIRSKDLFISQSALTGESMPVEKYDTLAGVVEKSTLLNLQASQHPMEQSNLAFMGTSVVSGTGKAIVITTGNKTYFGSLAKSIVGHRKLTSFDKGINSVTWLLIRFILVMIPIIFAMNGLLKGDWQDAFLFAIAVAVGLTPEMLPMVVTANLAKGALAMSSHKVIVKRLNSIQNLGAMDILCTDKTGTLTQDRIILEKYLDPHGDESAQVLEYGFLNSYYQSGLKNMLDKAILNHAQVDRQLKHDESFKKVDEIPFDFVRRRMSVVLNKDPGEHLLICKGAVEELLNICSQVEIDNNIISLDETYRQMITSLASNLNQDGFRVIAVAYKILPLTEKTYTVSDEHNLIMAGVMAFLDPPKETAREAIETLKSHGVTVKILTGDNDIVTQRVCQEVGVPFEKIILGDEIANMSDEALALALSDTHIFAKLTPLQKSRIIRTLQKKGHTVGFLGDGINDAAALYEADVGISVDSATDIARESADIILLEKSLLVLGEGVLKGREVYGNIIKYIKMTASSNFGNVFSVLIASAFLPFLPMLPLQLLIQNLFYDISQLALPWDKMDKDFLIKPRKWEPTGIARFMVFIGPISSIFDVTTFLLLWFFYEANSPLHQTFFQSGWFVEGLLSQTLVVHMIRTQKIPFIQSTAAAPLLIMTAVIMLLGLYLPYSLFASDLHLVQLPASYFFWLFITLLSYCALIQVIKIWYIKKFKSWL